MSYVVLVKFALMSCPNPMKCDTKTVTYFKPSLALHFPKGTIAR